MNMPNRIRFDDVLWATSDPKVKGRELQKFKKNVEWCRDTNVVLTPAILCQDIEQFPEAIEQVRRWFMEGMVYPDLHGWDHGPYAPRTQQEIEEHLDKAEKWFWKNFKCLPVRWVTPHGADSPAMQAAAAKYNMVIETTAPPVIDQKQLDTLLRETWDLTVLNGRVIMNHWWDRGLRLYRIARIIEHQNVLTAIDATRSEMSEADHKICWASWARL